MKERCEELEKKLTFTAAFVCVGKNKYKTDFLFFFQKKRFSKKKNHLKQKISSVFCFFWFF